MLLKASRKRRIAAFLIDHFVMSFVIVSMVFVVLGSDFIDNNNVGRMATIMLLVMIPGFLIYFAKDSVKGISIGKWILGIMVRNESDYDTTPSFGRLLVRNLFIIIWPVEFIVLAISEEKKRLGDKVSKTVVLKNPNKPKVLPRILTIIAIGVGFGVFTMLFVGSTIKNSDAYKISIQSIETNKEIINITGGITGYGMMPAGNINITNGHGQARLEIKVRGKKKDMKIITYLEKEPEGQWKLIEMKKYY
jgi:uncharacterized RDD family membrane protein YckC